MKEEARPVQTRYTCGGAMTTSQSETRTPAADPNQPMKRRGLLAAAWAAMAAVILNRTTQPVEAGVDGDVVLGAQNSTSGQTIVNCTMPNSICLWGNSLGGFDGWGVLGQGSGYGVAGFHSLDGKPGGAGVYGGNARSDGYAIYGTSNSQDAIAVFGDSFGGIGVLGRISVSNGFGVYGANTSSNAGPVPGAGGFGVYGVSVKGHGTVGAALTAGGAGIVGATNGVTGAYAGAFYGPVAVLGDFTVFGPKSAAVPHPDGSHRRLYCVESPESWFEDFGKGQLDCGCADVTIDPDFAAVADVDDYHVFLTQNGHNDLAVTEQTPHGFRVEGKDPTSTTRFSWRIVAKRKDIPAPRFETVTVPAEPVLPAIPEPVVPELPQFPDMGHLKPGRIDDEQRRQDSGVLRASAARVWRVDAPEEQAHGGMLVVDPPNRR
jgi:hypothetical protein